MKIKKGYFLKEVAGQNVVVATGEEAIKFNAMMTLNKTAKLLFEALFEDKTEGELVQLLVDTYDITHQEALKDVRAFILVLKEREILNDL